VATYLVKYAVIWQIALIDVYHSFVISIVNITRFKATVSSDERAANNTCGLRKDKLVKLFHGVGIYNGLKINSGKIQNYNKSSLVILPKSF
jgi:hypothetical protein